MVKKKVRKIKVKKKFLSTGSSLINMAISDRPDGGFEVGKYYLLCGDSGTCKTFLAMTCFAEATIDSYFKDYELIYDNVEDGMLIDVEKFFGKEAARRIRPPRIEKNGDPVFSTTVEEFYHHLDDAVQSGKRFVYVLDSMDGLDTEEDSKKFEEVKKAVRAGKEAKTGSYGMSKAKKNSTGLRRLMNSLRKTKSILIITAQTRDNVGFGFNPKTRGGGHALKFYATVEMWTSFGKTLSKTVRGKIRKIGSRIKIKITKNRVTGFLSDVEVLIYPSHGFDDIGACVDYLVSEKHWHQTGKVIKAHDLGLSAGRDLLIKKIEDQGLFKQLQKAVKACWMTVRNSCSIERQSRYR